VALPKSKCRGLRVERFSRHPVPPQRAACASPRCRAWRRSTTRGDGKRTLARGVHRCGRHERARGPRCRRCACRVPTNRAPRRLCRCRAASASGGRMPGCRRHPSACSCRRGRRGGCCHPVPRRSRSFRVRRDVPLVGTGARPATSGEQPRRHRSPRATIFRAPPQRRSARRSARFRAIRAESECANWVRARRAIPRSRATAPPIAASQCHPVKTAIKPIGTASPISGMAKALAESPERPSRWK
jgi:hypothetical protein